MAAGDISINSYESVSGLLYNYEMAEKYQLADPFEMVKSGTWTLDRLNEMATAVAADLNGDAVRDIENDQYGFISNQIGLILYYGANELITAEESEERISLKIGDERSVEVLNKILSMISNMDVFKTVGSGVAEPIFKEGRVLFILNVIYNLSSMREADLNVCVPFPDRRYRLYRCFPPERHAICP